jgi:molybdopterin molybdotransferase
MISLATAQARLIELAQPLPVETVALSEAVGRWAAEAVVAQRTQPVRDLSAMDGYAVAHQDCPGPWRLIGESAAGVSFRGQAGRLEAVRIFTGASLPAGTDTVIIQEDISRDGETIGITKDLIIRPGQHVRLAGGDFTEGAGLIDHGERLTPARIALAAMGGYGALPVHRVPRIEILSTGDELVPPGAPMGDDQIPNSNAVMLAALLRDLPCTVISGAIIPDDMATLVSAIRRSDADILVTCGGASVGDHDLVRPALIEAGAEIDFWKVAMRPGKPLMAGRRGAQLVLGLPGNPVSAFVTAILFLRPMIAALSGSASPLPQPVSAILGADLPATGNRTDHIRAVLAGGRVVPVGLNDSAALASLARANALIVRPADSAAASVDEIVDILLLP